MYDDALPFTGAGITVAGIGLQLPTIMAIAAGAIIGGILAYRFATRKRRAQTRG
ncbi:hypothetical protein [Nonomuraea sp. NPDC050310]|uniref:hypothetical protein n=1 Tax=Nonomuraea sp. NPDC050310 TaxID=3154935 RepID=UPI0034115417